MPRWLLPIVKGAWALSKSGTFWTAVAAITGVVVLVLQYRGSVDHLPPSKARLIYSRETALDINATPGAIPSQAKIVVNGKEERGLRLFVVWFQYRGTKPLLANDFALPLQAEIPSDRKILDLHEAPDSAKGPQKFTKGGLVQIGRRIKCFPTKIDDNHFSITPTLMNPDEWFAVEIYTASAPSATKGNELEKNSSELNNEVSWECHVAGVECPEYSYVWDTEEQRSSQGWVSSFLPFDIVILIGGDVYAVVLWSAVNVALLFALALAAGLDKSSRLAQLWFIAFSVALSMCTAEILLDWFGHWETGETFLENQPGYARVIAWTDILLIGLLIVLIIRKQKKRPLKTKTIGPVINE